MHWVDRGIAPKTLGIIRERKTNAWVNYAKGIGKRPNDSDWRKYHEILRGIFFGLCAFCEEECPGEIDHFRPKSRFPELVYDWGNWLFVCHSCNLFKHQKWPLRGYVDPCALSMKARPEEFFAFDTVTGFIMVRPGLTEGRWTKATRL